jgi:hypothetical protein
MPAIGDFPELFQWGYPVEPHPIVTISSTGNFFRNTVKLTWYILGDFREHADVISVEIREMNKDNIGGGWEI